MALAVRKSSVFSLGVSPVEEGHLPGSKLEILCFARKGFHPTLCLGVFSEAGISVCLPGTEALRAEEHTASAAQHRH